MSSRRAWCLGLVLVFGCAGGTNTSDEDGSGGRVQVSGPTGINANGPAMAGAGASVPSAASSPAGVPSPTTPVTGGMAGRGAELPGADLDDAQAGALPPPDDRASAADGAQAAPAPAPAATPAPAPAAEPELPPDYTPAPDNPPECPAVVPDNPVGPCDGLPVYLECVYGEYYCVCDWYHWLCI